MNFTSGRRIIFVLAFIISLVIVAWQLTIVFNNSQKPQISPLNCYEFAEKQTVKEFYDSTLLAADTKVKQVFDKLPRELMGRFQLKYVWACSGSVYIVSYSDKEVNNYFEAPISIEIVVNIVSTPASPGNNTNRLISLVDIITTDGFEIYIYRPQNDDKYSYTVTIYDVNNRVRYSIGFLKIYDFDRGDVENVLKKLFGIQIKL